MQRRDILVGFSGLAGLAFMRGAAVAAPRNAGTALVSAARARVGRTVIYDPAYQAIGFPGGDLPDARGVCTDVVIRAYRAAFGWDLQRLIHEDISAAFGQYPAARVWGQKRPDANIDHRRVPNIERFLLRQGARLWPNAVQARTVARAEDQDYVPGDTLTWPGDILTWRLDGRLPHIGIVARPGAIETVIHNIGAGTREDMLTDMRHHPLSGHYRWLPG